MNQPVVTEFTPKSIDNRLFSIPLYQRLYAWEKDQVVQLLDDLYSTFTKCCKKEYFIGNLVTSEKDEKKNRHALIDGQQRITTLWLMGFVLKQYFKDWEKFIVSDSKLRLDFLARKDDRLFLEKLSKTDINSYLQNEKLDVGVNQMMVNTINIINNYLNQIDEKESFSEYIYTKTKIVIIILNNSIDLNKYFEIMNNRGIQLEKHEILKARIIENIWDEDVEVREKNRSKYALIWDACSQMNRDIEKSFDKIDEKINIREEIRKIIKNKFFNIENFINKITIGDNKEENTLEEIIRKAELKSITTENDEKKEKSDYFTSVINFPSFLLHVYKLFANKNISLKDKDLLTTIRLFKDLDKKKASEKAISFIQFLFKIRIIFDQYIIRSYKNGISNLWETRILTIDEIGDERKKAYDKATQIMSMINVSTSSEHWLTPVLKYLTESIEINDDDYTTWLENLDNCFAYARIIAKSDMMRTANNLLNNIQNIKPTGTLILNESVLNNGVNTDHYWFYKLDYCLWKKWTTEEYTGKYKTEIKNFQFRSNRSIEHIYPQHPDNKQIWKVDILNNFGNLALISVRSNSGYNNQLPIDKRLDFEKRINNWGIESLKLVEVYKDPDWDEDKCIIHSKNMLDILNEYHNKKQ